VIEVYSSGSIFPIYVSYSDFNVKIYGVNNIVGVPGVPFEFADINEAIMFAKEIASLIDDIASNLKRVKGYSIRKIEFMYEEEEFIMDAVCDNGEELSTSDFYITGDKMHNKKVDRLLMRLYFLYHTLILKIDYKYRPER